MLRQRRYFLLPLVILPLLFKGCNAQTGNVQAPVKATPSVPSRVENTPDDPLFKCPSTVPSQPAFVPPAPFSPVAPWSDQFWHGSNALWTALSLGGKWPGLPHNPEGYTQKIFWWSVGYSWIDEPEPDLIVTGRRLDASAPPLNASQATHAYANDIGSAMLVGVDFPAMGCWEITGEYKGASLSFVIWIGP